MIMRIVISSVIRCDNAFHNIENDTIIIRTKITIAIITLVKIIKIIIAIYYILKKYNKILTRR